MSELLRISTSSQRVIILELVSEFRIWAWILAGAHAVNTIELTTAEAAKKYDLKVIHVLWVKVAQIVSNALLSESLHPNRF